MLMPRKTKYRKIRKGKNRGLASRGTEISFGTHGLMATTHGRINSRQIESARRAMTRYVNRGGKIWIRIFPHTAVTNKPNDVPMGGGKGSVEYYVAKVKPGTVLFEITGVEEDLAREAMRLAAHKLPVKTRFVIKGQGA